MRRSPLAVIAVGVLWLAQTPPGVAADDDLFQFFEEEAVVVAASKHPQKLSEAPASAYVVTARDIERYGYRTLSEALQSVPGVYVTNDRNYSYIWVRGFGRPGDYNSRVLVLVNGHRVNDNLYGFTSPDHAFPLDIKSVERIEVIKGPGSALYGDNALLGVINVVTKTPSGAPGAQVNLEAGSYGTLKEFVSLAHRLPNGLDVYVGGSHRRMNGQNLSYPEFAAVNGGVAQGVDGEEDYDVYLSVAKSGLILHGNVGSRTKQIPTGSWGTRFNDPGNETTDFPGFVEVKVDQTVGAGSQVVGRAYYDWYHYRANLSYDNATPPPAVIVNRDLAREAWVGEELRVRFTPFGPDHALTLGEEFEKNLRGLQVNYDADPFLVRVDDNRTPYRWALFAQQEWTPRPAMGITLGLRYDAYESWGKAINPRVAAVVQVGEQDTVKLLYGTAFRAPTPYEMFWADFSTSKPNPSLQPEHIRTAELVWQRRIRDTGEITVGAFESRINRLISSVTDPLDGLAQYINKERISSRGIEVASKWEVPGVVSGHLGYILQGTREVSGSRLSNSPRHSGSAGLSLAFPALGASAGIEAFAIGRRTTFQQTVLPATAVLSLNLSARPWPKGPRLYAGAYNLTDTDYAVSGGGEHVPDRIRQDGRHFNFGLEHRF